MHNLSYYDDLKDFSEKNRLKVFYISAKKECGIISMFDNIKNMCFNGDIKGIEVNKNQ